MKDFLRESHLKHHIKSAHSDIRDHVCHWEGCGKSFITATRLRRHQAAHEGKEKFRCTNTGCGQTFRKHGTLQKHIITVHEQKHPFVCGEPDSQGLECGAGFDTEGKLSSHVGRVHGTKRFVCAICVPDPDTRDEDSSTGRLKSVFPTHALLQAHIATEHPPTCGECGLRCTSQSALKNHFEVMHGGLNIDERRTHICPEPDCGRGFTKKGNLNAHIQINHAGRRFICDGGEIQKLKNIENWNGSDACGEAFKSKANLERHIRGSHLGLGPSSKPKKDQIHHAGNTEQVSTLTRLTGEGYGTHSGRSICCLMQDCHYRFMRDYDLEMHLQSYHHLADIEVQEMLMEKDFYDTSRRPCNPAMDQIARAPYSLCADDSNDIEMDGAEGIHQSADSQDAHFWINGVGLEAGSYENTSMGDGTQRLCGGESLVEGGGNSRHEDADMIDPSLT